MATAGRITEPIVKPATRAFIINAAVVTMAAL
jgi:hypothetical protein